MVCAARVNIASKPVNQRVLRAVIVLPQTRTTFRGYLARRTLRTRGPTPCCAQVGLFFSTSTGKTEDVASLIKEVICRHTFRSCHRCFSVNNLKPYMTHPCMGPGRCKDKKGLSVVKEMGTAHPKDISDVNVSSLVEYDGLVVGAPTWNTGADSERSGTGWDDVLNDISGLDLSGKPVAVFGLGDSVSYGEYFCDAMEEVYRHFKEAGAKMVGHWPADDYQHEDSKALLDEGLFCGLALDEDNEDDKTEGRVKAWVKQLKGEGF